MWSIQWNDNEPHFADSIDEVNEMLDKIHQDYAEGGRLTQIVNGKGETLLVGLGRALSVLIYAPPEGWPSRSSRNDQELDDGGEVIGFFMGSHWSEMPKNYAIPIETARKAVIYFCITGKLLPCIQWVDD